MSLELDLIETRRKLQATRLEHKTTRLVCALALLSIAVLMYINH